MKQLITSNRTHLMLPVYAYYCAKAPWSSNCLLDPLYTWRSCLNFGYLIHVVSFGRGGSKLSLIHLYTQVVNDLLTWWLSDWSMLSEEKTTQHHKYRVPVYMLKPQPINLLRQHPCILSQTCKYVAVCAKL